MEQILERETGTSEAYADIIVYDDDGSRIRNPRTLRAIAEAQKFIALWDKMIED